MRKLIHSNFEIDLANYKIVDTEENPWFLEDIPLKFTFPFEIDLSDEMDANFGFISSYNNSPQTLFPLVFQDNDTISEAELELEELGGKKLAALFRSGIEQLPSWDKKLSELTLDNFDLENETIYEHARTIIPQTWPAVNYNFPSVHIDTIDNQDELWLAFKRRINDYNGIEFPDNYVDETTYEPVNRNIIQPLPYALHILKQGLLDAGLELQGNILDDERLKKMTIYSAKEYFIKREDQELNIVLFNKEYLYKYLPPVNVRYPIGFYQKEISVPRGRFNILGQINITARLFDSDPTTDYKISFDGVQIASGGNGNHTIDIDVLNDTNTPKIILVECDSRVRMINPNVDVSLLEEDEFHNVVDLQILALEKYDTNGDSIPTIINENKVDLTKAVADITFGEYFKTLTKHWFNYDYDIQDGIITMNKVEEQINYENAFDLSPFEIKEPIRRFKQGYSFLLKFSDADNEFGYVYDKIFQSSSGVVTSGFKENEKTTTIEINALPLPLLEREGITTAHAFESSESKIYAVVYDGMTNNRNVAKNPVNILLPAVHTESWLKWFSTRINAQEYRWPFKAWAEQLIGLKAKGKAFAYGRYHIIKKIQKTEIQPDLYEVDIEMESLE